MEFVESWMTSRKPGSDSKYKTTKSRWTDPEADIAGNEALIQAGIVKEKALAAAKAEAGGGASTGGFVEKT